jgi:hypothetical protein
MKGKQRGEGRMEDDRIAWRKSRMEDERKAERKKQNEG